MLNSKVNCQREFEWIQENFQRYKRELELINRQNPYECELYSVIATVIRCCMWDESISLRDVSSIRLYEKLHTINLRSSKGFPDFVILGNKYNMGRSKNKSNSKKSEIFGAVEVKYLFKDLYSTDRPQINAHIRYFKKVIYTNGLEWEFYGFNGENLKSKEIKLGICKKENRLIEWSPSIKDKWQELLIYLHEINWKS